jgi:hypothetical protein
MKPRKSIPRRLIKILCIAAGLYGGWIVAGVLNDHRNDVPRPYPTTNKTINH